MAIANPITWRKEEILFIHEDDDFLVQLAENNDLIFWELVDTRFVGASASDLSEAHEKEIHPTEDTIMVRQPTGYTKLYRQIMRVAIVSRLQASFLQTMLQSS